MQLYAQTATLLWLRTEMNGRQVGFLVSFLVIAVGAVLGATGEMVLGAALLAAGGIGSFTFLDR